MIQIVMVAIVVAGLSLFGNFAQWQRNSALSEQLTTAEQERDDAKAQAKTLAAASRRHAAELAVARKRSTGDAAAVRKAGGDCFDRDHGPAVGDVLRMRPPNGQAKPAAPG